MTYLRLSRERDEHYGFQAQLIKAEALGLDLVDPCLQTSLHTTPMGMSISAFLTEHLRLFKLRCCFHYTFSSKTDYNL
ncbi:hypothetical protein TNCV_2619681 [Trichonephila clavipes]|uniref:Uncharacterized protein n=1 Tax=Trichonephila clavipes TaxID=2585209 RepID=A0A8X6WKG4_TRICX|nr:hypothetical protein TNCV_2619681 [Trichonephila clavipes]